MSTGKSVGLPEAVEGRESRVQSKIGRREAAHAIVEPIASLNSQPSQLRSNLPRCGMCYVSASIPRASVPLYRCSSVVRF